MADDVKLPEKVTLRGYNPTYKGHKRQIEKALELLSHAERPLIYAGGGIISSNASPELVEFATLASIPVTTTLMGIGCIPCHHPLNLGMLGMHGTEYANFAVTECDLMIAIGARFDDRVTGQDRHVRTPREDHPHRHRPGRDRQEQAGRCPDRWRCESSIAGRAGAHEKAGRPRDLAEEDQALEAAPPAQVPVERCPAPAVHHQDPERPGEGQGRDRLRGRAEPDVDCPALLLPQPADLDHLRRSRHDGVRASRRDGGAFRPAGRPGLRYSPATAASR